MNLAEKVAATYLRLNGFLILPHFTVFVGEQHNHIDLIAFRAAGSKEVVGAVQLLVDERLFEQLEALRGEDALLNHVGIAAEVRSNPHRDIPTESHADYVKTFLGGIPVSRLAFFDSGSDVSVTAQGLDIGIHYAGRWILSRIDSMHGQRLTKDGSWSLSESFLADILTLRNFGLLR